MLSRAHTFKIDGLDARPVTVEVDVRDGLPSTTFVGIGDQCAREIRERVRCAILNSNYRYPTGRVTVNIAPANLRALAAGIEFPIALAVLAASGQLDAQALTGVGAYGALSLSGELRSLPGTIAVAEDCQRAGITRLLVPGDCAPAAATAQGPQVLAVYDLVHAVESLSGKMPVTPAHAPLRVLRLNREPLPDLADVRGNRQAILALQVAAAGGHHLLLEGPAGSGKTMLARRLPGVMAPLSDAQTREVHRVYSVAGLRMPASQRPFRAPHHSISLTGLLGGGSPARPGEATLANHGVLYLDELEELQRGALDALRGPLADGQVTLIRGERALRFPTRFTLLAGLSIADDRVSQVRQRRRVGALLDRFDLRVHTRPADPEDLAGPPLTDTATVRARVIAARERQTQREQAVENRDLPAAALEARLSPSARHALAHALQAGELTPRAGVGVLRVAQTLHDLYEPGASLLEGPLLIEAMVLAGAIARAPITS